MPPPSIDDYLRRGYLPENLPPSFGSGLIADYFAQNTQASYLSEAKNAVQPAVYSASKRGMTRRNFAVMHPVTGYDLARFADEHGKAIWARMKTSPYSVSVPEPKDGSDRALDIPSHSELEKVRLEKLSGFRFVAKTDVSRFYHSIYTHSVPWAFHSKSEAKADRDPKSKKLPFNRLDYILRCGQDGQTIGVPVGPDVSRLVAEGVFAAIDDEFQKRCTIADCDVIRHVDDIWIGANSHAHAEEALWRYREAIRAFELDINESKTHIYSDDFRFSDSWPTDISEKIDYALESDKRVEERLRTALEYAFKLTSSGNDDGVSKFVIRYLDQSGCMNSHWDTVEPYLRRNAVHFGHSLDYVSRILVWKKLTGGGLDVKKWSDILLSSLGKHGRLGNDSEVCWTLYATEKLGIVVDENATRGIIENCGALSITATLNLADMKLAGGTAFDVAREVLSSEDGSGAFWPTILEWKSRGWAGHDHLQMGNDIIAKLVDAKVTLFARASVPKVFQGISAAKFALILQAIEQRVSAYDDDDNLDDVFDDETDDNPVG